MSGKASIQGGAGDDSIRLQHAFYSDTLTVQGGKGDDLIDNNLMPDACANAKVQIEFHSGDGHDTVTGLNANDSIVIDGGRGEYLTQTSGDDVTILVGEDSLLLRGAATLDALNIIGTEIFTDDEETPKFTVNGTTATFGTANETLLGVVGKLSYARR